MSKEQRKASMAGKKAIRVTVLVAAALACATAPTANAVAAASPGQPATALGPNNVLMYEDFSYTGSLYVDAAPGQCPENRCEIDWWDGDNEISSIRNRSTCTVRLYANDGWTGDYRDIGPNVRHPNLRNLGFDNQAESFAFRC